jgi:hypothetical protein
MAPSEVTEYIERIIATLDPRDELEYEQATRTAICFLRLRGVHRYEAQVWGLCHHVEHVRKSLMP